MQQSFPNEYVQLINCLSTEEQTTLKTNIDVASQQKIECNLNFNVRWKLKNVSKRCKTATGSFAADDNSSFLIKASLKD